MEVTEDNPEPTEHGEHSGVNTPQEVATSENQKESRDDGPLEEIITESPLEEIEENSADNSDQQQDSERQSKQLVYQHTKIYQDSNGVFVIDKGCTGCREEDCDADQFKEKPATDEDGSLEEGTQKKEQALRYLEAFASSVAEEMKKQAALEEESSDQATTTECESSATGEISNIQVSGFIQESQSTESPIEIHNEDEDECERQDFANDDGGNPDEIVANVKTEEDQQEHVVTVVVTEERPPKEITEVEDSASASNKKTEDKNTLRRSKRKRRSKKRGFGDEEDGDDGDFEETLKKGKKDEKNVNPKDEGDAEIHLTDLDKEFSDEKDSVKVTSWLCKHCNKVFMTNTQYKQHLRTHSDQKPHQCIFCSKRFRQKCQKDKHERIHTGAKPYRCRHCDRAFSESGSRNRHERIHTGYKPYVCLHCDKSFIQKGNKDAHEKIHTTFKPFKCPNENCNDTFASEEEVKKHREGHPQKPYKCHYCCKGFPFNAERKRHERCHTGVKPYKCSFCDKTFTQKGNKDNHERTHTGDKPHCCTFCHKGFIRKQYLEKHMKKKHGKDMIQQQLTQQPAVYAVLEIDPNLQKDGHLAAESLLKAAHLVAQHQVTIQNGGDTSVEVEQLGQVMAEVSQQLSNVEHHVAIVEQDGVQHQVQVLEHHAEVNREEPVAILGQIVEEHEVIGIQNQVVVGEPDVSKEGQQHITDEEGRTSVVELPAVETRLVSHQILQDNTQFGEDNQEFTTVDGQAGDRGLIKESIIVVSHDGLATEETESRVVSSQEQLDENIAMQANIPTDPKETDPPSQFDNSDVIQQQDGYDGQSVQLNQEDKQLVIHGHNIVIRTLQD